MIWRTCAALLTSRVRSAPQPPPYPPAAFARQVFEQRVKDAAELLEDLSNEAGSKTSRQKHALANGKIYTTRPVAAGAFLALREHVVRIARELEAGDDDDAAVTPVTSLKRGARPADQFTILDDSVVNEIMGPRVAHHHHETSGTVTKLVAPVTFSLKGKRDHNGQLLLTKELTARAHFVALVRNHGDPAHPIFRTDDDAFTYSNDTVRAYMQSMANIVLATQGLPVSMRNWALSV